MSTRSLLSHRPAFRVVERVLAPSMLAALLAASAVAQAGDANPIEASTAAAAGSATGSASQNDPILGPPLEIDGEVVPADAIRRLIVLSGDGRTLYELTKLRVFIEREMQRQIKEDGRDPKEYEVAEAEVQGEIDQARAQVKEQYSGQEVTLEDILPDFNTPTWTDNLRLTKLFRRVYLPANPHDYPPITVQAITAGENGEVLLKALVDQYDAQHLPEPNPAGNAAADPAADGGQQFMDMLLQQSVVRFLNENADIKEAEDGIAPSLLGVIDGVEIPVQPIWEQVKGKVGAMDVRLAKLWFVNMAAARKGLKGATIEVTDADGNKSQEAVWIDDEEAHRMYDEYAEPYKQSFLSIDKIATVIKKFPTVGLYKEYYQLQESFKRLKAAEMTDEALIAQGDKKTAYLVSQAKVDADVILLSAYDFKNKRWKDNGWADAERRAKEVAQKLAAGEDWNNLVEQYSDFYDPPLPTQAQGQPDTKLKNKGRFRGITRNELLRNLEESDYWVFLTGSSVTDSIFFEQEITTIQNPIKGPYGWYIPRLLRKTPPTRRLSATDETQRDYLIQDWVADNLNDYVHEQVAKLKVSGLAAN